MIRKYKITADFCGGADVHRGPYLSVWGTALTVQAGYYDDLTLPYDAVDTLEFRQGDTAASGALASVASGCKWALSKKFKIMGPLPIWVAAQLLF